MFPIITQCNNSKSMTMYRLSNVSLAFLDYYPFPLFLNSNALTNLNHKSPEFHNHQLHSKNHIMQVKKSITSHIHFSIINSAREELQIKQQNLPCYL